MNRIEKQEQVVNNNVCPFGNHELRYISTYWTNSTIQKYCDNCKKWVEFSFWPTVKVLSEPLN